MKYKIIGSTNDIKKWLFEKINKNIKPCKTDQGVKKKGNKKKSHRFPIQGMKGHQYIFTDIKKLIREPYK